MTDQNGNGDRDGAGSESESESRKVVLGVTGCIGAYKAAEIVRGLKKKNFRVQVIMTKNAGAFITPLTLETLSEEPVITDLFGREREEGVRHISLTEECDLFLVAPASADVIAKLALGLADDFLTTFALATRAPLLVAPAMNTQMLAHPAVQANLALLVSRGAVIVEPGEGWLACGWLGKGRLAEPDEIVESVVQLLSGGSDFAGETVLVSAGPTAEPLDPVRVLTNRSSGKMGFRIAEAARARGAKVRLVSGPSAEQDPAGIAVERVQTAAEMKRAMLDGLDDATVIVMAAAVADYRPKASAPSKIKKSDAPMTLELVRTDDILLAIAERRRFGQIVVGFAAETEDVESRARDKLKRKRLDLIVANDVSREDAGFQVDQNEAKIVRAEGDSVEVPLTSKAELAHRILDEILLCRESRIDSRHDAAE
jgi:phosphopantothenoylcysteine decarboxylase/phosphopantothenate--cysteine ligase